MSASWNDFVTAALIGSEKAASPELPPALAEAVQLPEDTEKPTRFLTAAGAFALWRRAGWRPQKFTTPLEVAEPETLPAISRASAGHFREMLGGRFPGLIGEWLGEVVRLRRRLPAEILPAALEFARVGATFRPLVAAAGGARAEWLARHNPAWSFSAAISPSEWETGSREQRRTILRALRAGDPAVSRTTVEGTWKTEPAELRAAFLTEFEEGLSAEDGPFLESALDDRSKEVRRIASDLLARVPQSGFVARMIARSNPLLKFTPGKLLSSARLESTLPADPDPAATRDGVDPKAFGAQKILGGKAVMLAQILAAVPLTHWESSFGQAPEALLKAAEKDEFARAIATGWAWAAIRQRNALWAEAILDTEIAIHPEFLPPGSLVGLLPEEKRAPRLIHRLYDSGLDQDHAAWVGLSNEFATFEGHLPTALANALLTRIRRFAAQGIPWHFKGTFEGMLLRIPPSLLPTAINAWPMDQQGVPAIVEFLSFRHDILQALTAS